MKHHFFHASQIALGLLLAFVVLGYGAAVSLPMRLAQVAAPIAAGGALLCLVGALVMGLLLAGMELQQREHDAHMKWLLDRATRKLGGKA